ncbi:MAG: hypothetical protein Q9212_005019 [Teloschistes hypoglaucus]
MAPIAPSTGVKAEIMLLQEFSIFLTEGTQILSALQSIRQNPTIFAIGRRETPNASSNTKSIAEPDSEQWATKFKSISPTPDVFLSALGTTRTQAGSFAAQRTIDFDLNLSLARAAKESGVKTYVLISSGAVSSKSRMPYQRLKGEIEDAVKALDFPHTVIVKPGLLVGKRQEGRLVESVLQTICRGMRMISQTYLTDWWAQDVDVIGRATVAAALECAEGKREKGVWLVEANDILRLGKQQT